MVQKKTAFISTSIPYVNSAPHIGHAFEYIQTDTIARILRAQNYDLVFTTGSDENAMKNVESAKKVGVATDAFVNTNTEAFLELTRALSIQHNVFIRTTSHEHHIGCQKIWNLCQKDIYKKVYKGLYCIGCENFYNDGELPDNICPDHKRTLEIVEEENYFFALSKYQDFLEDLISSDTLQVLPSYRKTEVLNFIRQGLQDFSISRPAVRTGGWGVSVPGDENQRMYVWFDALTNYITALGFGSTDESAYKHHWEESDTRIHVVGKDIIKFHAIYWPAMLHAAGLKLPTHIFTHGFLTIDGVKMSKTLGNVINPHDILKTHSLDVLRYYFLREVPTHDDGDFSLHRLNQLYDAELVNELGNTVSRVCALAAKDGIKQDLHCTVQPYEKYMWSEYQRYINDIRTSITMLNKEMNVFAPWQKDAKDREEFLKKALCILYDVSIQLQIFMPQAAEKMMRVTNGVINKIEPLFPRSQPTKTT